MPDEGIGGTENDGPGTVRRKPFERARDTFEDVGLTGLLGNAFQFCRGPAQRFGLRFGHQRLSGNSRCS